ncbi:phage holin [Enterobacter sp.]|uniref:phage holin n=1 Tax=Enterobacter sp. TaxID=42895 RepID=UPI003D0A8EF3
MKMDKYSSHASFSMAWLITAAGAMSLQDWAVLIGILLGIGTFAVNWYYKRKLVNSLTARGETRPPDILRATDD